MAREHLALLPAKHPALKQAQFNPSAPAQCCAPCINKL